MTTHECLHEEQIVNQSQKLAELEAKNGFKEERIKELIEDNRRIESKIDKLTENVNDVIVNSITDDKELKEEITKLKTKIETQEKLLKQYKEEQRKEREDERAKTNQYLVVIGLVISGLSFIFVNLLK